MMQGNEVLGRVTFDVKQFWEYSLIFAFMAWCAGRSLIPVAGSENTG